MKFNWRNFPFPEPFIAALLGGGLLQLLSPAAIHSGFPGGWVPGAILTLAGLAIASWAVITAGENELEKPATVITRGLYALSRNPMYLAWLIFAIGLTLVANSIWLAIGTFLAWIYLNFITIPDEERSLQHKFGAAFEAYRGKVRRWV
jgi:protein-S-isoprenylcysteine O-methyltransferase Ste14